MGRKRKARAVQVYVGSTKVGVYSRAPDGSTLFRYNPDSDFAWRERLGGPSEGRIEGIALFTRYLIGGVLLSVTDLVRRACPEPVKDGDASGH